MRRADFKNYYQILGIPQGAKDWEIKRAYRKMVRKFHPDFNPKNPDCEDKLKEINKSYEILIDPKRRREFDLMADLDNRSNFRGAASMYAAEEDEIFSKEDAFQKEREKAKNSLMFFLFFAAPPVLYLSAGQWGPFHFILQTFVIIFVGFFYLALFFGAKTLFHGATVLVIHTPPERRRAVQLMINILIFSIPMIYFAGEVEDWNLVTHAFSRHSMSWFLFAAILIGLTWTFGAYFKSHMAILFPFRLSLLAIFLTFILAFCKAMPMVHKEEAVFDYLFFNVTIQTGLALSKRSHKLAPSEKAH